MKKTVGKLKLRGHWNKATEQWRFNDCEDDKATQEFFDCQKFEKLFVNLDKTKPFSGTLIWIPEK